MTQCHLYVFIEFLSFYQKSKPIKAAKRTRWTKSDFAYNDEAEERNYAEVVASEDEADRFQEMPLSDELSGKSSSSESYED